MMIAAFALVAAMATPKRTESAFLHDFAGTWSCRSSAQPPSLWRITRVPGSRWARVDWGIHRNGQPAGTAFVGYIPALGYWVYRDFHGGGSYANLSGSRATDGSWTWAGPYFPYLSSRGSAPLEGRITWKRSDAKHFKRTFASLQHGKLVPGGGDTCTAVSP